MEATRATDILAALGHPGRLAVFRLPARRSEIAVALAIRPNTLSVYLAALETAGIGTPAPA